MMYCLAGATITYSCLLLGLITMKIYGEDESYVKFYGKYILYTFVIYDVVMFYLFGSWDCMLKCIVACIISILRFILSLYTKIC